MVNRNVVSRVLMAALTWCAIMSVHADEPATPLSKTADSEKKIVLASPPPKVAAELLRLHNAVREANKKPPLRLNPNLSSAAQKFAAYLAKHRNYDHNADGRTPDQRIDAEGYQWGAWSENIAWGMRDPATAVKVWMNSPGHRENILSEQSEIGFGIFDDVWVADFGTSLKEVAELEKKKREETEKNKKDAKE